MTPSPDLLAPKDSAEDLAVFRSQVVGPLLCRDGRTHGELAEALRELARTPVRPPGSAAHRTYSVATLQRWYYAFQASGLTALRPARRAGVRLAQALSDAERELLLEIRRAHPRVPVSVILVTLIADGRLDRTRISASTLRRFYRAYGLDAKTLKHSDLEPRRRWQTSSPNALWHADVCHGPALRIDGRSVPLRIHAILDDYSRSVIALQASTNERESEMLMLMIKALRSHPAPEVLYLDNGATCSGKALATACARVGIGLVHAKPYDPQARGKMERFWRTLREQCLDHCTGLGSLHDVQVRLLAWLNDRYLVTPHGGLLGRTPAQAYADGERRAPVTESVLREALIVRARRRVLGDGTVSIAGTDFELDQGYLAGRNVTIARSLLDPTVLPWVEHEEQRLALRPVDPQANGKAKRAPRAVGTKGVDSVPFDPAEAVLDRFVGRAPRHAAEKGTAQ
ncbi:MAG: DDE-type integrase/transposase/recombinase [Sandaracinaceae bacterium]|nr:DDE-type integrase/transposase/recombinase [Sandaracinaceae bacterium]